MRIAIAGGFHRPNSLRIGAQQYDFAPAFEFFVIPGINYFIVFPTICKIHSDFLSVAHDSVINARKLVFAVVFNDYFTLVLIAAEAYFRSEMLAQAVLCGFHVG